MKEASNRRIKHLFHVEPILRARLQVRRVAIGSAPRLHVEVTDCALKHVSLGADDDEGEGRARRYLCVIEELLAPHGQVAEAGEIVEGESKETDLDVTVEVGP